MSLLPVGIGNAGGEYTLENSLRFRQSAGAYLTRPQSSGNRTTWTWSAWVKLGYLNNDQWLFGGYLNNSNFTGVTINSGAGIQLYQKDAGSTTFLVREAPIRRDYSSWYHFVIAYDSTEATNTDRIRFYTNGEQITTYASTTWPDASRNSFLNYNSATANIGRSLTTGNAQFDGYQTEINFIDGQALDATDFGETDATTGVWKPKAYSGTYGTNGFYLPTTATTQAEGFNTVLYTGKAADQSISDVGFTPDFVWTKSRGNAYQHNLYDSVRGAQIALQSSTTSADLTGYPKSLYSFDTDGFTLGNQDNSNFTSGSNAVAWCWDAGANQATTGISSVKYEGSAAAQSIKGLGFSPDLVWIKNRNGTAQNHMVFDSVRGPNLRLQPDNTAVEFNQSGSLISFDSDGFSFGTSTTNLNLASTNYVAWGWDAGSGDPVTNTQGDINSILKASDATGFSIVTWTGSGVADDRVGHGLNSAPEVIIYKNRNNGTGRWYVWTTAIDGSDDYLLLDGTNVANNIPATYTSPTSTTISNYGYGSSTDMVAYCFKSVSGVSSFGSYTGTGATGKVITTGFRPGFLMIKRTDGLGNWVIVDATRDPFTSYMENQLYPNLTSGDYVDGQKYKFTDTGFEFLAGGSDVNASGGTYIYMAFKGSYSDYVSPLNTSGSIDSRVKANTEKGFSIVSYKGNETAGATVGHGLTSAPEMVIVKNRDSAYNWTVYHKDLTSAEYVLVLNSTAAEASSSVQFNSTAPSSSVITLGWGGSANNTNTAQDHIAYCFHSVAGYSKFGSYTGTGSSGNSVTTGFRPAFLMIKSTDATSTGWIMVDNTRDPDNLASEYIYADSSAAEATYTNILEFTDTGFELIIGAGSAVNQSGVNYIYMAFADTRDAQFNFDASGNKNNWLPNNINSNASSEASFDIMTDVPTLTDENTANYCTLNPLRPSGGSVADGNLTFTTGNESNTYYGYRASTFNVPSSGKWYFEVEVTTFTNMAIGLTPAFPTSDSNARAAVYYRAGNIIINGTTVTTQSSYTNGDLIGIALDKGANTIQFYKNNTAQGSAQSISALTGEHYFAIGHLSSTQSSSGAINFGQRPFKYTPPTGFLPLNTYNLPDSTIEDGSEHFNTVLYTGNGTAIGSGGNSITGVGFQPDWTWIKSRSFAANHCLTDAVRGVTKTLFTDGTFVESTLTEGVSTFDSDGFTVGNNASMNTSSATYVAWNWKANGSGVSNTIGDTNATVSANTTSGFSIVSFNAGAAGNHTVGHGLGVTPEMIIMKDRDSSGYGNWTVFHSAVCTSTSNYLLLNGTSGLGSVANSWGSALPTSTVFGFGSNVNVAANDNIISYCFAPVEGFSAFGSYIGNGSTDGTFVYTGFRPAWVMVKRTSSGGTEWVLFDTKRDSYNEAINFLFPSSALAENPAPAYYGLDFVSNGFKWRQVHTPTNSSGATYIYAAFAENPFKNALAR